MPEVPRTAAQRETEEITQAAACVTEVRAVGVAPEERRANCGRLNPHIPNFSRFRTMKSALLEL